MDSKRIIVGVTGASGSIYAIHLTNYLISLGHEIHLILTKMGTQVLKYECPWFDKFSDQVKIHANDDLFSVLASGSYLTNGMVVIPCSMNTLGLLAGGIGDSLLARASQVSLKEKRPLIVVPREMPYNIIHLENMLRLARAGGVILPASPPFYHHPKSIEDLVNHVIARVLDNLHIDHSLSTRWEGVDKY